ncbi:MAG: UDP-N-acetylmuramoyl-tripeptide--D-alanyl-D-alanine ligase [Thioalkalispiraceae bacterium]|jgi:UDP-N-acetylmuramoyl-tripeptide--D-alanyl-D-alanine ligase
MSKNAFTMNLSQVAETLKAQYSGSDVHVEGISTDSRSLQGGELFIALRGDNFDGNKFAVQAIEHGAVACVLEYPVEGVERAIIVENTRKALADLAKAWRRQFSIPVIAVTGSNGKTTVKEMITSILAQQGNVLSTQGNLNNDIGVPLTLFRLDRQHDSAVIEMGANHPGEIAYLVDIVEPDVGIVNNAAAAHLEGFGSLEGVARTKGEMFAGLNEEATAVINADDDFSTLWDDMAGSHHKIHFALNNKDRAEVSADWQVGAEGSHVTVTSSEMAFDFHLALPGKHNVMNALAAIAATLSVNVPVSAIVAGLEKMQPVKGRLQLKPGIGGSRILDDTYNANPASLGVALDVLKCYPGEHFLALGDMGELGKNSQTLHAEAGKQARQSGVSRLFTLGPLSVYAAEAFGKGANNYQDHAEMIDALNKQLNSNITLLVKGSRSMHMEKIVNAVSAG